MIFSNKERHFREAYNMYYPAVYNILFFKLKNKNDIEDICQEVFISLYNNLEEVRDIKKWLYGALRYTISNFYRKKGMNDSEIVDIEDVQNDINLSFQNGQRDIRIIINEAIENKENFNDEEEKILFDLIAINKYTYAEAANQLGLTRNQVEYKYKTISKRIVKYLENMGITSIEDLL